MFIVVILTSKLLLVSVEHLESWHYINAFSITMMCCFFSPIVVILTYYFSLQGRYSDLDSE